MGPPKAIMRKNTRFAERERQRMMDADMPAPPNTTQEQLNSVWGTTHEHPVLGKRMREANEHVDLDGLYLLSLSLSLSLFFFHSFIHSFIIFSST